jgi:hypothetical protein
MVSEETSVPLYISVLAAFAGFPNGAGCLNPVTA